MKANLSDLTGLSLPRCGLIGLAALALAALQAYGQETPATNVQPTVTARVAAPAGTNAARLDRLEKEFQELSAAVKALRAASNAPAEAAPQPVPVRTQPAPETVVPVVLGSNWIQTLAWRSIGPANMAGRIVDFAVVESDPTTYWVATASGGLLKTTNNGTTFIHQFDHENTVSLGCVCVAPSNPNIVWVGTGENNPRNSVSYGDGVYKSGDGGKTWQHMGLDGSFQIGRIAIHPTDTNIVYVGALGRLYGPNDERGLYKTTDGGKSWQRVLYLDDKTGVIDLVMHPKDPDTLLVATWERQRDGYDSHPGGGLPDGYDGYDPIVKWGPGAGIFKTTDGGRHWHRITNGLPASYLGRIGLDYYRKDPKTVFAVIDCERIGMGRPPQSGNAIDVDLNLEDVEGGGVRVSGLVRTNGASGKAGLQADDLIKALDGTNITDRAQLLEMIRSHRIGDRISYRIQRGDRTLELPVTLERRPEAAGGPSNVYLGVTGEDVEGGVKVTSVADGSPAALAGLKNDDLIQAIGDRAVQGITPLTDDIANRNAGDKVKLKVLRDDQVQEIEVTLAERPQVAAGARGGRGGARGGAAAGAGRRGGAGGGATGGAFMGLEGEDVEGGIRVTNVVENGPAYVAGLKPGDVVKALGDRAVENNEQFQQALRSRRIGDKLELKFARADQDQQAEVTLTARRPSSANLGGQLENVQDDQGTNGFQYGGVYKSTDGGETWKRINSVNPRPMYFSLVKVDPNDDRFIYLAGVQLWHSTNGGKVFRSDASRGVVHDDVHALWIDRRDGRHMLVGSDGGFYVCYDRTANWDHINTADIGQFYHVAISLKQPYYVAGGLQDNGSWMGPSASLSGGGPINEDWINIGGGDGFVCRVDPNDPDVVYSESQDGSINRRNIHTGERGSASARRGGGAGGRGGGGGGPRGGGPGGDENTGGGLGGGFRGGAGGRGAGAAADAYRFNWNTPFILSSANSRIVYSAGNFVFRSLDRGNNMQPVSPEITLTKWGSGTALAESPRNPDVLYVGTDDGALWVTRDGTRTWTNITANVSLPAPRWVASIEPSHFVDGRAYVAFDCHRSDEDDPCLYVTEDFGRTWKSIRANLPWGSSRVLREDIQNPNLLLLGTEFGAWFSLDRGRNWNKFGTNFPTVAVHEFAFHPVNGEVVAATHGRSLWVLDVSPLRQITARNVIDRPALYQPAAVVRWRSEPTRGSTSRRFVGQNPVRGAQIYYSLPKKADKVTLKVVDISNTTIRELQLARDGKDTGLHRVTWNLTSTARQTNNAARGGLRGAGGGAGGGAGAGAGFAGGGFGAGGFAGGGAGGGRGGGRGGFGGGGGIPVPTGTYRLVLTVDGEDYAQTVRVESDPVVADAVSADEQPAADEEEQNEATDLTPPAEDGGGSRDFIF